MARLALAWLPAGAYMLLIWMISSVSHDVDLGSFPLKDKGVHLLEYAVLAGLLARAIARSWADISRLRACAAAVMLAGVWGYIDEVHQAFVPGRHADPWDLVADVVGGTLGVCAYAMVVWWVSTRRVRA